MSDARKENLYIFDFDGTLTFKDSLIEFLRFAKGDAYTFALFFIYSPMLVLMKLGLYSNHKAKQKIFSFCFKGMLERDFDTICKNFAESKADLLRMEGLREIERLLERNDKVMVVSASIRNWTSPLLGTYFNITDNLKDKGVYVIGTEIEVVNGRVTGKFSSHNCYGQEKVNRINAILPNRKDYRIIAYGDSKGDKELLEMADESHYKPFRDGR